MGPRKCNKSKTRPEIKNATHWRHRFLFSIVFRLKPGKINIRTKLIFGASVLFWLDTHHFEAFVAVDFAASRYDSYRMNVRFNQIAHSHLFLTF